MSRKLEELVDLLADTWRQIGELKQNIGTLTERLSEKQNEAAALRHEIHKLCQELEKGETRPPVRAEVEKPAETNCNQCHFFAPQASNGDGICNAGPCIPMPAIGVSNCQLFVRKFGRMDPRAKLWYCSQCKYWEPDKSLDPAKGGMCSKRGENMGEMTPICQFVMPRTPEGKENQHVGTDDTQK